MWFFTPVCQQVLGIYRLSQMRRTIGARNRKYINYSIHQILCLSCLWLQKSLEVFKRTENKKMSLSSKLWTWYATLRFLQWFGSVREWYNHQENKEAGELEKGIITATWNVLKLGVNNSVGHLLERAPLCTQTHHQSFLILLYSWSPARVCSSATSKEKIVFEI